MNELERAPIEANSERRRGSLARAAEIIDIGRSQHQRRLVEGRLSRSEVDATRADGPRGRLFQFPPVDDTPETAA